MSCKATMKTLCNDLNDRAQYVDIDIKDGIAVKPHPEPPAGQHLRLGELEWENLFHAVARRAHQGGVRRSSTRTWRTCSAMWVNRDPRIVYDGLFLQEGSARRPMTQQSEACTITYLNSAQQPVPMTFDDMMHRLFAMSFDPYHCVELRWGASGDERDTCADGKKLRWYDAEQRLSNSARPHLRHQHGLRSRRPDRHVKGTGIDTPPPVDIKSLIDSMPDQVAFTPMKPGDR